MSELSNKVAAMEQVLVGSTAFDRALMDRAMASLAGLDLGRIEPSIRRKLDQILKEFNRLADAHPDATDPTKPLPATVLIEYAVQIQRIRDLVCPTVSSRRK